MFLCFSVSYNIAKCSRKSKCDYRKWFHMKGRFHSSPWQLSILGWIQIWSYRNLTRNCHTLITISIPLKALSTSKSCLKKEQTRTKCMCPCAMFIHIHKGPNCVLYFISVHTENSLIHSKHCMKGKMIVRCLKVHNSSLFLDDCRNCLCFKIIRRGHMYDVINNVKEIFVTIFYHKTWKMKVNYKT